MSKHPTLLQHFRSFAFQNNIKDFATALEYFSVFGGTGWEIDTSKSVDTLIKEKILSNYDPLHQSITRFTHGNALYHLLLSHIALGIEHEDALFKKARVGREKGEEAMDYLEMKSLLRFEHSQEKQQITTHATSDKLFFELPFMRFWFASISPYYKSIASKDYEEFNAQWAKTRGNFSILLNNFLVLALVKYLLNQDNKNDPVISIGSYYDKKIEIQILAKTKSGKLIAGECKYSSKEAKPTMLTLLKEKCQKANLDISEYVLFSKNGFDSELVETEDKTLRLLSQKHLEILLENLSGKDRLTYKNKKY